MLPNKELAIIVYSCERNSDMWIVFSILFRKYWAECPFEVILVTDSYKGNAESGIYEDEAGETVFSKIVVCDGDWSYMIKTAIDAVETPFVSLWMDDYLLCDYVQEHVLKKYIEIMRRYHAANVRLVSPVSWPESYVKKRKDVGIWKPGTAYSMSTQIGIWDVNFLKRNIKDGWSAWDFERKGSLEIKDKEHPVLVALDYVFPYEEGVRRGKWMDQGVRLCRRNNIDLDFERRKQMSSFEMAEIYFKGGILEINPTLVVKIQNCCNNIKNFIGKQNEKGVKEKSRGKIRR